MNSQLFGADLEALGELQRSLDQAAGRVRHLTAVATEGATSLNTIWHGVDAADFRNRWMTRHRPTLMAAATDLADAAATIERNIDEQRLTSQVDLIVGPPGSGIDPEICNFPGGGPNPWLDGALSGAGIDLDQWQPELGATANSETIINVYRYYGDLYLADPDLQWAGMANAIGPSFAAGFFDLANFRQLAGGLEQIYGQLPPGAIPLSNEAIEALAGITESELRFYETTFLRMQYDIFLDQAPMHEAYHGGGIEAIRQMDVDCLIAPDMVEAWEMLDEGKRTGDQSLITEANTLFLRREQEVVIDSYYQEMYSHSPSGPAFTYLMTMIGTPSIPGAEGYAEAYPIDVSIETPGPGRIGTPGRIGPWTIPSVSVDNPLQGTITIDTPFPDGNLANLDDRWRLIEENTLPAYLDLDPDTARDLAAADVGERIDEHRLSVDDVEEVVTNWEVDFDQ